jgi:UDP-glucose 6-dehydrogenase
MGLNSRIRPCFLHPGIGYGESCFPKDISAFRSVADQLGIDFSLLTEVEKINTQQRKRFVSKAALRSGRYAENVLACSASPSRRDRRYLRIARCRSG